jgi:hypothetical protein
VAVARFEVRPRERDGRIHDYQVLDHEDADRPVATFDDQEEAAAHAARLNEGPFDWDEQGAWKDEWDED